MTSDIEISKPSLPYRKRILFVDDDPLILRSLSSVFHRDRKRWEMVFVVGGEAGLAELRRTAFDILVTDMFMPGLDGISLLAAAKLHSPATVRIMLTGSLVDHRKIDAYAVVPKPWNEASLRDLLERVGNR